MQAIRNESGVSLDDDAIILREEHTLDVRSCVSLISRLFRSQHGGSLQHLLSFGVSFCFSLSTGCEEKMLNTIELVILCNQHQHLV